MDKVGFCRKPLEMPQQASLAAQWITIRQAMVWHDSIPHLGKSHMLRPAKPCTNHSARALEPMSLTTTKPVCHTYWCPCTGACVEQQEKAAQREARVSETNTLSSSCPVVKEGFSGQCRLPPAPRHRDILQTYSRAFFGKKEMCILMVAWCC